MTDALDTAWTDYQAALAVQEHFQSLQSALDALPPDSAARAVVEQEITTIDLESVESEVGNGQAIFAGRAQLEAAVQALQAAHQAVYNWTPTGCIPVDDAGEAILAAIGDCLAAVAPHVAVTGWRQP